MAVPGRPEWVERKHLAVAAVRHLESLLPAVEGIVEQGWSEEELEKVKEVRGMEVDGRVVEVLKAPCLPGAGDGDGGSGGWGWGLELFEGKGEWEVFLGGVGRLGHAVAKECVDLDKCDAFGVDGGDVVRAVRDVVEGRLLGELGSGEVGGIWRRKWFSLVFGEGMEDVWEWLPRGVCESIGEVAARGRTKREWVRLRTALGEVVFPLQSFVQARLEQFYEQAKGEHTDGSGVVDWDEAVKRFRELVVGEKGDPFLAFRAADENGKEEAEAAGIEEVGVVEWRVWMERSGGDARIALAAMKAVKRVKVKKVDGVGEKWMEAVVEEFGGVVPRKAFSAARGARAAAKGARGAGGSGEAVVGEHWKDAARAEGGIEEERVDAAAFAAQEKAKRIARPLTAEEEVWRDVLVGKGEKGLDAVMSAVEEAKKERLFHACGLPLVGMVSDGAIMEHLGPRCGLFFLIYRIPQYVWRNNLTPRYQDPRRRQWHTLDFPSISCCLEQFRGLGIDAKAADGARNARNSAFHDADFLAETEVEGKRLAIEKVLVGALDVARGEGLVRVVEEIEEVLDDSHHLPLPPLDDTDPYALMQDVRVLHWPTMVEREEPWDRGDVPIAPPGRGEVGNIVLDFLLPMDEGVDRVLHCVALSGIGGMGKSTLAKWLCRRAKWEGRARHVVWVDAESEDSAKGSFRAMAEGILRKFGDDWPKEGAMELREAMRKQDEAMKDPESGERDKWSCAYATSNALRALPGGTLVVLDNLDPHKTGRDAWVCEEMGEGLRHFLRHVARREAKVGVVVTTRFPRGERVWGVVRELGRADGDGEVAGRSLGRVSSVEAREDEKIGGVIEKVGEGGGFVGLDEIEEEEERVKAMEAHAERKWDAGELVKVKELVGDEKLGGWALGLMLAGRALRSGGGGSVERYSREFEELSMGEVFGGEEGEEWKRVMEDGVMEALGFDEEKRGEVRKFCEGIGWEWGEWDEEVMEEVGWGRAGRLKRRLERFDESERGDEVDEVILRKKRELKKERKRAGAVVELALRAVRDRRGAEAMLRVYGMLAPGVVVPRKVVVEVVRGGRVVRDGEGMEGGEKRRKLEEMEEEKKEVEKKLKGAKGGVAKELREEKKRLLDAIGAVNVPDGAIGAVADAIVAENEELDEESRKVLCDLVREETKADEELPGAWEAFEVARRREEVDRLVREEKWLDAIVGDEGGGDEERARSLVEQLEEVGLLGKGKVVVNGEVLDGEGSVMHRVVHGLVIGGGSGGVVWKGLVYGSFEEEGIPGNDEVGGGEFPMQAMQHGWVEHVRKVDGGGLCCGCLIMRLARFTWNFGRLNRAFELYGACEVTFQKTIGEETAWYASTLHNMGGIEEARGRLDSAWSLYERSLSIAERVGGQKTDGYATTLHNMGGIEYDRGRLDRAWSLYERSLSIAERVGGQETAGYASTLHQMGGIEEARGHLDRAWSLYGRSLSIFERVGGQETAGYATTLNQMGATLVKQGRRDEAIDTFKRSHDIFLSIFRSDGHPSVRTAATNLRGAINNEDLKRRDHYRKLIESRRKSRPTPPPPSTTPTSTTPPPPPSIPDLSSGEGGGEGSGGKRVKKPTPSSSSKKKGKKGGKKKKKKK